MAWNGPMQIRECGDDMTKLKAISTWFDSENPDVKSSYKLPHHLAAGSHSVVWNGVKAAMGALLGARGGVDVPSGDRKGIYNHLKSHYGDFDEEAPEFKSIEEIDEDKSIETLSSQISGLQTQMSAMADTIKTAFVTDKRENKGKRKLVLVTTKKHAQIIDKQVGTGQPNVNGTTLGQMKIVICPFPEQHAIVAEIDKRLQSLGPSPLRQAADAGAHAKVGK